MILRRIQTYDTDTNRHVSSIRSLRRLYRTDRSGIRSDMAVGTETSTAMSFEGERHARERATILNNTIFIAELKRLRSLHYESTDEKLNRLIDALIEYEEDKD